MTFFLQNPALAWLLALAAAPLLIHLIARARPPVYRFSNVEFLGRVLRLTSRVRKPADWLLLLLRTLGLTALAAAFLLPVLVSRDAPLPGERRTAVIILDATASMTAREDAGIRFENACAAATRYLASARPDAVNIVLLRAEPKTIFPEPGPNREALAAELERVEPAPETGALQAAFELALSQLAGARGHKELAVISDFQASAWKDFSPQIPENIKTLVLPVAHRTPPNLAITSLTAQPAEPVAGQRVTLLARVRNFSGEARRVTLTLNTGGARQSQPLDVPARGDAETAFTVRVPAAGMLPAIAEIDPDTFPGDDRRMLALRVRETLRLAVAAPESAPETKTLARLAAALPWLEIVAGADVSSATTTPADFWLLPNFSGKNAAAVAKIAAKGKTVFLLPAAGLSEKTFFDSLAITPGTRTAGNEAPFVFERNQTAQTVTPAPDAAAFALFAGGEYGNPLAGKFRERIRFSDTNVAPPARTLATYSDGIVALADFPAGRGNIVFFNLPLDPAKTDWPAQNAFLPAFAELLLRTRNAPATREHAKLAGAHLTWLPEHSIAGDVTLVAPDGKTTRPENLVAGDTAGRRDTQPARPGLYRWLVAGQETQLDAVNFPETESDLSPLPEPPAFGSAVASPAALERAAEFGRGVPAWPWLIAAALAAFFLESLISSRTAAGKGGKK